MNQKFIDEIEVLKSKKSKLVEISSQVGLQIAATNEEMLNKQDECQHTDKDEKRAIKSYHPFKICEICGKVF